MQALIIVDVQNDFLPGGSLGVAEGDQIYDPINSIRDNFDLVVFTQDWHPANHCSFKENGGMWPVHCVQDTKGAEIDPNITRQVVDEVIQKGIYQDVDSYSGFWDNEHRHGTRLNDLLQKYGIRTDCIAGIATEYCVKFTALDAKEAGYNVFLVSDACKGVNPADTLKALEEMKDNGIYAINSSKIF